MTERFDLLIIGAGPGGYETAVAAAAEGLSVGLIEKAHVGGTCLNRGCIPTKTLCRSAEVAETMGVAADFGIRVSDFTIDYEAVCRRKAEVVEALRQGVESLLSPVKVVRGTAVFVAPDTVEVDGHLFTAPKIIVATGSRPATLPIPGAEFAINSDQFLEIEELPRRATVIGGGVIGMEFAHILASFGVEVNVVEACREILPGFDAEVAKRLRMSMKRRKVNILTDARVSRICEDRTVVAEVKGKEKRLEADLVIMAAGRTPVLPAGLDAFVETTSKGAVRVDGAMRAVMKTDAGIDIRAIGDVNGLCMLAHAATAQGRVALGHDVDLSVIPSAVFTRPELAMVGLTEQQCLQDGIEYTTATASFRANGKAVAMGEPEGMVKMLLGADGTILGCHIMGPHASDLIAEATLAMSRHLTLADLKTTVHAHPTLAEIFVSVH